MEAEIKILLIEDNSGDALLFTEMLDDCQFRCNVRRASRIGEAVALLDELNFDLVVMDLKLPDESGSHAVARIRENTDLPIIILTGSFEGLEQAAAGQGVIRYFQKGKVDGQMLCNVISQCCLPSEG